jgi:sarcosine oxidase subunit alpha
LTFTSGGATFAEVWVRDWAETLGLDVRIMNRTFSLGAINVTGPLASALLTRAGVTTPPAFLHHTRAEVAGVPCRILRLSFTGEVSYELHHAAADSVHLWYQLLLVGSDLGVRPHGLEALLKLRLEKGHLLVGQDTDFDSSLRRLGCEWAVQLSKPAFVGRQAVVRTNRIVLDRQLCGLEMDGAAPDEGATIWARGELAGVVTSSTWSPTLGKSIMLGWVRLKNNSLPDEVTINGRPARRVPTPFYDPEGRRARA